MKITATVKTLIWIAIFIAILLISLSSYVSIRVYKHFNPSFAFSDTLRIVEQPADIVIHSKGIETKAPEFNITVTDIQEEEAFIDSAEFKLRENNYSGSLKLYYSSLQNFGYDLRLKITPEEVIIEKPYEKTVYVKQDNKIKFLSFYAGCGAGFALSEDKENDRSGKFRISGVRADLGFSVKRRFLIFTSIDTFATFYLNLGYIFH
jgi:hypothetical protein